MYELPHMSKMHQNVNTFVISFMMSKKGSVVARNECGSEIRKNNKKGHEKRYL